jgi:hypothetical protein
MILYQSKGDFIKSLACWMFRFRLTLQWLLKKHLFISFFGLLILVECIFLGSLTIEITLGIENIPLTESTQQHSTATTY